VSEPPLEQDEWLRSLRYHIDRYDRLRAATASRASVLLAASALALAASGILLNRDLRATLHSNRPLLVIAILLFVVILGLIFTAVLNALSALVSLSDGRSLYNLPGDCSRGIYNQTDAVTAFPEVSNISSGLALSAEISGAEVELWVNVRQHKRRYEHLRRGIRRLRAAILALLFASTGVLIATTLWPR